MRGKEAMPIMFVESGEEKEEGEDEEDEDEDEDEDEEEEEVVVVVVDEDEDEVGIADSVELCSAEGCTVWVSEYSTNESQ